MKTAISSKNNAATKGGVAIKKATAKKSAVTKASASGTDGEAEENQTPFENMFNNMLKDIYWAEQSLVGALQKMSESATTEALKDAFEDHMFLTQKHVRRLEKVFKMLGKEAEAKKCEAMAGLIKESEQIVEETEDGSMTRDAGLIIAAQKVEHYEIASYGSLVQVAITLGHTEVAELLDKTLNEEEETDSFLTEIAESDVNPMADQEDNTEDENEEDTSEEETV